MNHFKKKITAFTAMLAFLSLSQVPTLADMFMPGEVLGHTSNTQIKDTAPNRTDVNVNGGQGAVGQVDWKNFGVASGNQVNFGFSNVSQTVINRVLGGEMSKIMGKLTNSCTTGNCDINAATSKVILINPAGVVFGQGSQVDLNSFTVSTFDFRGAKNIKGTLEKDNEYQLNTLNKISPDVTVNKGAPDGGQIHFDSHYTSQFEEKGIDVKRGVENKIELDGATFAKFDENNKLSNYNTNKSVAFVADNVIYKDSIVRTGDSFNYNDSGTETPNKSFGNVKIVTGDGVTFAYIVNGYIDNSSVAMDEDTSNAERHVLIDNENIKSRNSFANDVDDKGHIRSGNVRIVDNSTNANSDIKIKNAIVKGTKLVDYANGNIWITGGQDVSVENSRLESTNTSFSISDKSYNTNADGEGKVMVEAGKDLNVKDSLVLSAGSTNSNADAGRVKLQANNDLSIDGSEVIAKGNADIIARNSISAEDSLIQAADSLSKDKINDATIRSLNGNINLKDTIVHASRNIDLRAADASNALTGDITIDSTRKGGPDSNDNSSALLAQDGQVSIQGKNTKIDDSSLVYNNLKFYDNGTTGLNNVTIADNSTFSQVNDGVVSGDINLETNGNLTFDHANVQSTTHSLEFKKDNGTYGSGTWSDNKQANAYRDYQFTINRNDANNLNATSTKGDVIAQNQSNLHAKNDVTLNSLTANTKIDNSTVNAGHDANILAAADASVINGSNITAGNNANVTGNNVTIDNSTVTAKSDANITAKAGKLFAKHNSTVKADKDVNLKSHDGIKFAADNADGTTIGQTTKVSAGNNINVTSDKGDIEYEKTQSADMQYDGRLKFQATEGSNKFHSENSLKSVNVDYVAGVKNEFVTGDDIQFVDSTLEAKNNTIETQNEGGDVILNNLEIKKATPEAKDTVTEVKTKGNITTRQYGTNESGTERQFKYPQNADYDVQLSDKESHTQTTLDLNQTKFKAETSSPTSYPYDTKGSIDLQVREANNPEAGIELKAENADGWDEHSEAGAGPEIHLNAEDNELAVSKLVTDKLFLSEDDTLYAAPVELTPAELEGFPSEKVGSQPKGYIEVKDYEGFNFDKDLTQDEPNNPNMDYTGHYVPGTRDPGDGTVQQTKEKHTFEDRQSGDQFLLDYTRPDFDCPPAPSAPPEEQEVEGADSLIDNIRLPREQIEISKTSKVSDNTVDQTSNIMSAAAKVDLGQETEAAYDDDDDDIDE